MEITPGRRAPTTPGKGASLVPFWISSSDSIKFANYKQKSGLAFGKMAFVHRRSLLPQNRKRYMGKELPTPQVTSDSIE
jgi:hypothetical protein